jgi:hypothetical protein
MAHKPAPVQVSFLGFPTSTGAKYIDYYLGDPIALPAEGRDAFTEKIAYMPTSCIANDYAQLRGDVLQLTGSHRLDRSLLRVSAVTLVARFTHSSLCLSPSLCLCLSLSVSLCLCLSLSVSLSVSVSLTHTLSLSQGET